MCVNQRSLTSVPCIHPKLQCHFSLLNISITPLHSQLCLAIIMYKCNLMSEISESKCILGLMISLIATLKNHDVDLEPS